MSQNNVPDNTKRSLCNSTLTTIDTPDKSPHSSKKQKKSTKEDEPISNDKKSTKEDESIVSFSENIAYVVDHVSKDKKKDKKDDEDEEDEDEDEEDEDEEDEDEDEDEGDEEDEDEGDEDEDEDEGDEEDEDEGDEDEDEDEGDEDEDEDEGESARIMMTYDEYDYEYTESDSISIALKHLFKKPNIKKVQTEVAAQLVFKYNKEEVVILHFQATRLKKDRTKYKMIMRIEPTTFSGVEFLKSKGDIQTAIVNYFENNKLQQPTLIKIDEKLIYIRMVSNIITTCRIESIIETILFAYFKPNQEKTIVKF